MPSLQRRRYEGVQTRSPRQALAALATQHLLWPWAALGYGSSIPRPSNSIWRLRPGNGLETGRNYVPSRTSSRRRRSTRIGGRQPSDRPVVGAVRSFRHHSQRHAALTSVRGVGEHLDAWNRGSLCTAAVAYVECPVDPSEPRPTPSADPQPADRGDLFCRLARPTRSPFRRVAFSAGWPPAQPHVAHSRRRDCRVVGPFSVLPASRCPGSRGHGHDLGSFPWRVERTGSSRRHACSAASRAFQLGVRPHRRSEAR
jgi:hypothetical protein